VSEVASLPPAARDAIARISAAEERARYSLGTQPGAGLRTDVATARTALAASTPRGRRLRARLLPASTLAAASRALQSVSQATSWLDSSWPNLGRQLRRTVLHRAG
jgi:hypothetical protein